jgi:hypothetical protein
MSPQCWACPVKFKDSRSVSSIDVAARFRIPEMLRHGACWKFASFIRNVDISLGLGKFCCENVNISESSDP